MSNGEDETNELKKIANLLMTQCKDGGTTMVILMTNDRDDVMFEVRTLEMDQARVLKILRAAIDLVADPEQVAIVNQDEIEVLPEGSVKH